MHPTMKFSVTESSAYPQFLSLYVDDFVVLSSRKVIYPVVTKKARWMGVRCMEELLGHEICGTMS